MSYELIKGETTDYNEIINLANFVFEVDFKKILPHIYDQHPVNAGSHYLIKEHGVIKALLLCQENILTIGRRQLRVVGIGTVCVHPDARGKNYMKILMNRAIADCRTDTIDIMELGGQRQRYEYFGFTPCETVVSFGFTSAVRSKCQNQSVHSISLIPFPKGGAWAEECRRLHGLLTVRMERHSEFFTNNSNLFIILQEGLYMGYLIRSKGQIGELVMKDYAASLEVVFQFMNHMDSDQVTVRVMWFQQELIGKLTMVSDSRSILNGLSFQVLNYRNVIAATMETRHQQRPLQAGKLILCIEGQKPFEIIVDKRGVLLHDTDREPDYSLSHLEAMDFLFSPMNLISNRRYGLTARDWFPLPLSIWTADGV